MRVKVAIVDDTPDLRMLVRLALEGHTDIEVVAEGENGQDGIRIAEQLRPDVMLLDLAMPVMDGMTALPHIRARSPQTQVLVLSGFAADTMTQKALQAGAKQYIQKGASPEVLRRTVLEAAQVASPRHATPGSDVNGHGATSLTTTGATTGARPPAAEVRLDGVAVTAADRAPFGLVVATRDEDLHGGWRIAYRNAAANDLVVDRGEVSSRALLRWHPELTGPLQQALQAWETDPAERVDDTITGAPGRLTVTMVRTGEREIVIGLHPGGEGDDAERLRRAIATAAHEIRNPVTVLAGVANAFGDPTLDETRREALLAAVLRQSRVLERLTDDLLTAARAQVGTLRVDPQPTPVGRSVEEAIADVFPDGGVGVTGDTGLVALADPTRLAQMLANLLSNAAKYGEPPVTVDVRAETRLGRALVLVSVSDRGPGVPEGFREAMFEEYTRADGERARGTGLGLYVVRSLARAHGGEVEHAPRPGGGAEFTLMLPRPQAQTGRPDSV